jgi:hypothetical protein
MLTPCDCENLHAHTNGAETKDLGVDLRNGRSGHVTLHRCPACGAQWLHYLVEYEAFSRSGRWFCGRLDETEASTASASSAIGTLAGLTWYWVGGSYFGDEVAKSSGPVPVDLYGPPAME